MWLQRLQDLRPPILLQTCLLLPPPTLGVAWDNLLRGRRQILTDVIEINQILALGAEAALDLLDDPGRSITDTMHLGAPPPPTRITQSVSRSPASSTLPSVAP